MVLTGAKHSKKHFFPSMKITQNTHKADLLRRSVLFIYLFYIVTFRDLPHFRGLT